MNVFYDHLVNIHELHLEFDSLNVPLEIRADLIKLADSAVHHEVFDLLMVEVPDAHRVAFLELFSSDPGDSKILDFLKEKIPDIEDKITARGEAVKNSLRKKIRSKK